MSVYQMRDAEGEVVAEESFTSFDEANVWSTELDVDPGWTLFQQIGGDWVPARRDPTPS